MEKIPSKIIRKHGSNWKNHVEEDLKLLLEVKGAMGAIVTSRNGDIITQKLNDMPKHKENALMQLVKKAVQTINGMRSTPLRRVIFETEEGSVVLYNAENAVIGCLLDKDYDLLTVMLEIKTVGELIGSHLNSGEITKEEFDRIVTRDPGELKALAFDLLGSLSNHYGDPITEEFIKFTLAKNQPQWAAR
jgi:predicted regulator of Ras-like GTPase activity (Roadblock/LC7/MglB family)